MWHDWFSYVTWLILIGVGCQKVSCILMHVVVCAYSHTLHTSFLYVTWSHKCRVSESLKYSNACCRMYIFSHPILMHFILPKKLLGCGVSTPYTFFGLICTINSKLKCFPIFIHLSKPGLTLTGFQEAFCADKYIFSHPTHLILICDVTHSRVLHGSCSNLTWSMLKCDMTHSHVWRHDSSSHVVTESLPWEWGLDRQL